jgi:predicted Rossmann fold nucleotide-binding protein DprA/Smf involved in DNA uptake
VISIFRIWFLCKMSGWGFGLLVVEAGIDSGALTSASQAADQGRNLYAGLRNRNQTRHRHCHGETHRCQAQLPGLSLSTVRPERLHREENGDGPMTDPDYKALYERTKEKLKAAGRTIEKQDKIIHRLRQHCCYQLKWIRTLERNLMVVMDRFHFKGRDLDPD